MVNFQKDCNSLLIRTTKLPHHARYIRSQPVLKDPSLSIGITRSQFEANEKDEVSNFCNSHATLQSWVALTTSYGAASCAIRIIKNLIQKDSTITNAVAIAQTLPGAIPQGIKKLSETQQLYHNYKKHYRNHRDLNEIHSLNSLKKAQTWHQWTNENKVPLILLGLGLACVATTVTLTIVGAPIIATMAAAPFIHTACVAIAHTFGISQIVAQASVLSGASGLIFPTLTGLLQDQKEPDSIFQNRQPHHLLQNQVTIIT